MELLGSYGHLPIRVEKDKDGIYTIGCSVLGFCTYGRTIEEGVSNLEKAVEMCVAVQKAGRLLKPYRKINLG